MGDTRYGGTSAHAGGCLYQVSGENGHRAVKAGNRLSAEWNNEKKIHVSKTQKTPRREGERGTRVVRWVGDGRDSFNDVIGVCANRSVFYYTTANEEYSFDSI